MALRVRGEALDEIVGAVAAMRGRMLTVERAGRRRSTSSAPAATIRAATTSRPSPRSSSPACGVPVAKHGNRAASSSSGTADVLAALGVKLGLDAGGPGALPDEAGLCFMFAQTHHAAMRHVAPVRVELGTRTIFNLLGPLVQPGRRRRASFSACSQRPGSSR